MRVYMVALTQGPHVFPVGRRTTIYTTLTGAQNALADYLFKFPGAEGAKILVADNWQEIDEDVERWQ